MARLEDAKMREYDLLSEAFYADPYPILAELRREDPCWFDPRLKAFVVTRHQDIKRVISGSDFSAQRVAQFVNGAPPHLQPKVDTYVSELSRWILFLDPPNHTVLRPRLMQSLGPHILDMVSAVTEQAVTEALDQMEASATADVIRQLAYPVPTRVLAHLLGISNDDIERFKQWTTDIFTLIGAGVADETAVEVAYRGVVELRAYVLGLLEQKRQSPSGDVISALANPVKGELCAEVPDDDIVGLVMALIVAGHETTTSLIGNAIHAILNDSSSLHWVLANACFPETAVNELIRHDGPVLSLFRRATRDVMIAGQFVPADSFILNVLIAGNRDPRAFDAPDKLNFDRPVPDHVGFGVGIHQCVGAPIARIGVGKTVPRFVRRFPRATVTAGCVWQSNISIRGMVAMPVILNQ